MDQKHFNNTQAQIQNFSIGSMKRRVSGKDAVVCKQLVGIQNSEISLFDLIMVHLFIYPEHSYTLSK